MKEIEGYRQVINHLPDAIKQAEVEAEKNDIVSATVTNGQFEGMAASIKTGLFVRVKGEKSGMTYTQDLQANPEEVLLEALDNAKLVDSEEMDLFSENMPSGQEHSVFLEEDQKHYSNKVIIDKAKGMAAQLHSLSESFTHVSVTVTEALRTHGLVNSLGLDRTFTKRIVEVKINLTYEGDAHKSLELMTSKSTLDELEDDFFNEKVQEWLELPTNEIPLDKNYMPAVIDATVVCNILLTAWQMFSGYDYMNKNTPFYNLLETKVGSSKINIADFPYLEGSGYGRAFDCQGVDSVVVDIIRDGQMVGLMHNLESAFKLAKSSTGNAGRDINLIQDRLETKVIPTNFTLCKGTYEKTELLNALDDGIYICESFDMFHSVNVASGDFTIPCIGIRYEKGKPVGLIKGISMNGNFIKLLKDTLEVANDRASLSMVMSKSLQVIGSSMLVSELYVTGGGI